MNLGFKTSARIWDSMIRYKSLEEKLPLLLLLPHGRLIRNLNQDYSRSAIECARDVSVLSPLLHAQLALCTWSLSIVILVVQDSALGPRRKVGPEPEGSLAVLPWAAPPTHCSLCSSHLRCQVNAPGGHLLHHKHFQGFQHQHILTPPCSSVLLREGHFSTS